MRTTTIRNPKTGRQCEVRVWDVEPRAVLQRLRAGEWKDARDISWALLSDDESVQAMQDEEYGEAAESNWALGIFEHALDWRLGIAVLQTMRGCVKQFKRLPKPFQVAVNRRGDVFVILPSGSVFVM